MTDKQTKQQTHHLLSGSNNSAPLSESTPCPRKVGI